MASDVNAHKYGEVKKGQVRLDGIYQVTVYDENRGMLDWWLVEKAGVEGLGWARRLQLEEMPIVGHKEVN
jgi:hypothetical protein